MASRTLTEDDITRDRLMLSAARVVGRKGYKAAAISRIADEAEISVGHCYKFFPSREAILEHLILWILEKFEKYSEPQLEKAASYIAFEKTALRTYFGFQNKHSFFIKILRDSEIETPETWQKFAQRRHARYVRALTAAFDNNEMGGFDRCELDNVARLLSSVRRMTVYGNPVRSIARDNAVATHETFVRQALGLTNK